MKRCPPLKVIALLLITTSAVHGAVTLKQGLVAHWSFDEDFTADEGGTAYDLVTGTFSNVSGAAPEITTGTAGAFGEAAEFERSNGEHLFTTESVYTTGDDLTYSAWYRLDVADISSGDRYFVIENEASYNSISYGLRDDNGTDKGQVYANPDGEDSEDFYVDNGTSVGAEDGVWHNIIVTFDADLSGGTYTAYLNGVQAGSASSVGTISGGDGIVIGGHRDKTGRNFEGLIDDVAVWDRVLNSDEINHIQTSPVPEPSLAAGIAGLAVLTFAGWRWRRAR
jgi:hypothetical protein